MTNKYVKSLRKYLLENLELNVLIQCDPDTFIDASVDVTILICTKSSFEGKALNTARMNTSGYIYESAAVQISDWIQDENSTFNLNVRTLSAFHNCINLGNIYETYFGIQAYDRKSSISEIKLTDNYLEIIDGEDINAFSLSIPKKYFNYQSENIKSGGDWKVYNRLRIVIRQIGKIPIAGLCRSGVLGSNTLYSLFPKTEMYNLNFILLLLNSKLIKTYWLENHSDNKGLFPKIKGYQLKSIPIKVVSQIDQIPFINIAESILLKNDELSNLKTQVLQLLVGKYPTLTLTNKQNNWPTLLFKDFLKELEKQKVKLSLPEQAEWMQYFEAEKSKAHAIQQVIDATDKEIDAMVYALYGLNEDEIAIVEKG